MGTVLVAEDSKTIRTACEWITKGSSHSLVFAEAGDEALQLAAQHHPAVIVLDYTLPDQDSYELCRTIKSHPQLSASAVLMLGGNFANFDEARAQQCGADASLIKPFNTDSFLSKLDELTALAAAGSVKKFAAAPAPAPVAPAPQMTASAPDAGARSRFQFPGRAAPAQQAAAAAPRRFSFPGAQAPAPEMAAAPMASGPATPPAPVAAAAAVMDEAMVRAELHRLVKEMLPPIVKTVLKELITKEVTPQLQRWVEGKVEALAMRKMGH